MRERPILFSAPMVRALLAGTKTQTRRAVKWRGLAPGLNLSFSGLRVERSGSNYVLTSPTRTSHEYRSVPQPCPYGLPGDRLWVRESWMPDPRDDGSWAYTAWAGCRDGQIAGMPERFRHPAFCNYAADWLHGPVRWTPSIHMPRWASRILLDVTEVRVERLQSISEEDAWAEGCVRGEPWDNGAGYFPAELPHPSGKGRVGWDCARDWYADLWEEINGEESWEANPWVWAVSFKQVTP